MTALTEGKARLQRLWRADQSARNAGAATLNQTVIEHKRVAIRD
jgi:hypothetical protein